MHTGSVHRVVCLFTPQLSLLLINQPRRDGTSSWSSYTVAVAEIGTHDLTVTSLLGHYCTGSNQLVL